MKNKQTTQKKLSLKKLQIAKINNPISIKGGDVGFNTGDNTKTTPTETK